MTAGRALGPGIWKSQLAWPLERTALPEWCTEVSIVEADTAELQGLFDFDDAEAIVTFLSFNPELEKPLVEAHGEIKRIFGEDARLELESVSDIDALQALLRVTVETHLSVTASLENMREFYGEWWIKRSAEERTLVAWTVRCL